MTTSSRGRPARPLSVALLLAAVTLAAFSRAPGLGFLPAFDDGIYVLWNPQVLAGLAPASIRWAFTTTDAAFWHPLTWLSHMLDVELFGVDPAGHHATAVVLHAAAAVTAFFALRALSGSLRGSAFVSALFAVHPQHVESVAWVSERKDVLCALFWFLGLLAYAGYVRRPSPGRLASVFAAFAAALMSKSMAITFPFVLLLLDYWPLDRIRFGGGPGAGDNAGRVSARRALLEKVPFFLLVPIFSVLSYRAQVAADAINPLSAYDLWARVANAPIAYVAYLVKTVLPTGLAVYYPHPGPEVSLATAAACTALLAVGTVAAFRRARAVPFLVVGWLWYLGTLVPVLGIVQFGQFSRADRYTYLPLVGIFVIAAGAMARLCGRTRSGHRLCTAAGATVVAACAAATWVQSGYWRDPVTLWTRAVAVTGDNLHARLHLGVARLWRGELGPAEVQFREALRINPVNFTAMYFLSDVLDATGRTAEGAVARARARELDLELGSPTAVRAPLPGRPVPGLSAQEHNNAGVDAARRGRNPEAEAHFRAALERAPAYAPARYNLANLLRDTGRLADAEAEYERTTAQAPGFALAHLNLGVLLEQRGDRSGARDAYRRALLADPALTAARDNLAALDAARR